MAISRATKTEKVKVLTKEFEHSTAAIVGTFTGLTASKDFDLRRTVRGAGASYHVVKNKLAAKASQGSKIEQALQSLKGVSAVAYTQGDPVVLAKALSAWVKDNSEFSFKLAIVDGQVLDAQQIGELATMPGREELFSKLLFLIQSPAQRLATVMNATGRDLAVVINQGVEKEKFSGSASAAAAPVAEPAAEVVPAAPAAPAAEAAPSAEAVPAAEPAPAVEAAPVEAATAPEVPAALLAEPEIAAAHAEEAPTPTEQAAASEASTPEASTPEASAPEAGEPAQPENSTASQGGEAANTEPAEG